MATWQVLILNKNFETQGELVNLEELKVGIPLNKIRPVSFKIRLDNPIAPFLSKNAEIEPTYVKTYRNGTLMSNGPIATVQEAGDAQQNATLTVNSTGPESIWAYRIQNGGAVSTKIAAGTARAVMFKNLLDVWKEAEDATMRTFIDKTTGPIEGGATTEYEIPPWKSLTEILSEMINSADGFDWTMVPTELTTIGGVATIGRLTAKTVLGESKPGAIFEWGAGRTNTGTFNRTIDISQLADSIYSVSPAGGEGAGGGTISAFDAAAAATWGFRQAQSPLSVLNTNYRTKFVEEMLAVRKKPRQTITFQPVIDDGTGHVPIYGTDYSVGDTVRARITYEDVPQWDVTSRVWGIEFAVDTNGFETQTLTLSEE